MSIFSNLQESFRDYSRDNICASLQSIGIKAQLGERGRDEEKSGRGSLGIIDIPEEPIRWINVCRGLKGGWGGPGDRAERVYYTLYGVPDHRLGANSRKIQIKSVRIKSQGQVVDLNWKGKDLGLGIIDRLNSDLDLKQFITTIGEVKILAYYTFRCWVIVTEWHGLISRELWNCYLKIADYLLEAKLDNT